MICALWLTLLSTIPLIFGGNILLDTKVGKLLGTVDDVTFDNQIRHVARFLGIPFAEPPIGDLRFRKPVPKGVLLGEYNATFQRPSCIQSMRVAVGNLDRYKTSEDCLTLNVYVPQGKNSGNQGNTSYPVMVFIYGGGYVVGSTQYYDGGVLSAFNDVIVVTVNYRLNLFGFYSTFDSASPGNYGLWDQRLGIKWVHDNIGDFGGDSSRVTIFGQSAGSGSVLQQALYPGNKGLFQNVIAESGSPVSPWHLSVPGGLMSQYTRRLANFMGCNSSSSQATVDCFRSKSSAEIVKAFEHEQPPLGSSYNSFSPVVDGDFMKVSPSEIFQNTNTQAREAHLFYRSLNVIVGTNTQEGIGMARVLLREQNGTEDNNILRRAFEQKEIAKVLKDIFNTSNIVLVKAIIQEYTDWENPDDVSKTMAKISDFTTDYAFLAPAVRALNSHAVLNSVGSTYFYIYSHRGSSVEYKYETGANHAQEVPFIFGYPPDIISLDLRTNNVSSSEIRLSKLMMAMWTNFAKTGNPNNPVSLQQYFPRTWPPYDVTSQHYININARMSADSVKQRYAAERVAFWLRLVPAILKAIKESRLEHHPIHSIVDPSGLVVG